MQILLGAVGRVLAAVSAIVMLWVGALHLRPFEYPAGFELIMPEPGCESHCILGIEPGVTTVDEAIEILKNHPATGEINNDPDVRQVSWNWDTEYRSFSPSIRNNFTYDTNTVINQITIPTRSQLRHFYIYYGVPIQRIGEYYQTNSELFISDEYAGFMVIYSFVCFSNNDKTIVPRLFVTVRSPVPEYLPDTTSLRRNIFADTPC